MARVDTVAFDKTGTLTYGLLEVCDVVSLQEGLSEKDLLALTASAEMKSEHPLGKAILAKAKAQGLPLMEPASFTMTASREIFAQVGARRVLCGSEQFLGQEGIELSGYDRDLVKGLRSQGKALVLTADRDRGRPLGLIALSDQIRPEAKDLVASLEDLGVRTVLLTGDNAATARYFAGQVAISELRVQLLPEEKVQCLQSLRDQGRRVAMIGDGVNDAPALKSAGAWPWAPLEAISPWRPPRWL